MSGDVASSIMDHLGPLTPTLDECLALSIASAEERCKGLSHARYGYARPLMVRADLRDHLEARELPSGWEVSGNPRQMGHLEIQKPGFMTLRFLRANHLQPGLVPHAGHGRARQAFWQDTLGHEFNLAVGVGVEVTLLLLWSYIDPTDRIDGGFRLVVAHPVSPGSFGTRVPCDLMVEIPRGGTFFEELGAFRHDEDENLFEVEIVEDKPQ